MSKLSSKKLRATHTPIGTWTPEYSLELGPTKLVTTSGGSETISLDGYTVTAEPASGGYAFSSVDLDNDATLRGHAFTMDTSLLQIGSPSYVGVTNAANPGIATAGHLIILTWNGTGFDSAVGNIFVDGPTADASFGPYAGEEMYFANKNDGTIELYWQGSGTPNTPVISFVATTPMVDALVSFGLYLAHSDGGSMSIVPSPIAVPGITQYQSYSNGPITNKPANCATNAYEIAGVPVEGIVSDIGLLTNGVYVQFDANEELSDTPSIGQHLTQTQADALYRPAVQNNLDGTGVPGVNDDETAGYAKESKWYQTDVSPTEVFLCTSAVMGFATWEKITLGLDDLGTMATQTAGTGGTQYRTNSQNDAVYLNDWILTTTDIPLVSGSRYSIQAASLTLTLGNPADSENDGKSVIVSNASGTTSIVTGTMNHDGLPTTNYEIHNGETIEFYTVGGAPWQIRQTRAQLTKVVSTTGGDISTGPDEVYLLSGAGTANLLLPDDPRKGAEVYGFFRQAGWQGSIIPAFGSVIQTGDNTTGSSYTSATIKAFRAVYDGVSLWHLAILEEFGTVKSWRLDIDGSLISAGDRVIQSTNFTNQLQAGLTASDFISLEVFNRTGLSTPLNSNGGGNFFVAGVDTGSANYSVAAGTYAKAIWDGLRWNIVT